MVARNDITGDPIQTKGVTDKYRNNYDLIFGKKKKKEVDETATENYNTETTNETKEGK